MGSSNDHLREAMCVTGSTGYIGSWLVHSLLQKGYLVHATMRDIDKARQVLSNFEGNSQLKIFKADLNEEGSFDEAVKGCVGVFHVAASMELSTDANQIIEESVKSRILEPAVRGTTNLLQSCSKAGCVKRVIFTSSISTITAKNDLGEWIAEVDESCVTPADLIWRKKPSGWVYVLSKLVTDEKAFQFAKEKGIDLVSIIPPTVAGPFLTPDVPTSIQVLLSPITGGADRLALMPKKKILDAVNARLGSISLVHIEDICNAHIFLMEKVAAEGRYICSASTCAMSQLAEILSLEYSSCCHKRIVEDYYCEKIPSIICSKRLTSLGFKFRYGLTDIIKQTVISCSERKVLKPL
ncbi:hypothetical protein J5N97_001203 [Dioscorea zingiberensis]|uniref:NAD-dependent epimerase/dehydratase domain-containing protein n=1 Tax=Dioscorea zingiberensis TaxID=325984 RepID=A0A9D5BUQ7_9LILI|nr:hypothetical protein J5N97_001203 [Dioscorea zingiberensis]